MSFASSCSGQPTPATMIQRSPPSGDVATMSMRSSSARPTHSIVRSPAMSSYVTPFQEVAQHFGLTLSAATEGTGGECEVVVLDGAFEGVDVHVYRATSPIDARWT